MNLLTDTLPTKIAVKDKIFDINYDYRTIIDIIKAFEDDNLTKTEKFYILIRRLYKDEIPSEYYEEACMQAVKFIDLGKKENNSKESPRLYSFAKDGSYIYTGISQTHKIDLQETPNMHWWKFMGLFMDMKSECMFGELTYYRVRKSKGKLTPEEIKKYKEIKDLVELEDVKPQISEEKRKFLEEFNKNNEKIKFLK